MEKEALALSSPSMADTHQLFLLYLFMKEAKLHGERGTRTLKPIHGRHTPAFFVMPVYERGKTHEEMDILRHTTPAFFFLSHLYL